MNEKVRFWANLGNSATRGFLISFLFALSTNSWSIYLAAAILAFNTGCRTVDRGGLMVIMQSLFLWGFCFIFEFRNARLKSDPTVTLLFAMAVTIAFGYLPILYKKGRIDLRIEIMRRRKLHKLL